MSPPDDQARLNILELLYEHVKDDPTSPGVDRAIIEATLGLSQKQMDDNTLFLEEKALVTLTRTAGSQWIFAKITADGTDVIENKERYADKFSFTQAKTSILPKEEVEDIQTAQPEFSFAQQITEAFNSAYDQVHASTKSSSERKKIEKQLSILERDLQKAKKIDLASIQKNWDWLKKNASTLCPIIAPVVLEGIKIALDLK
jgi:hypothetical protein